MEGGIENHDNVKKEILNISSTILQKSVREEEREIMITFIIQVIIEAIFYAFDFKNEYAYSLLNSTILFLRLIILLINDSKRQDIIFLTNLVKQNVALYNFPRWLNNIKLFTNKYSRQLKALCFNTRIILHVSNSLLTELEEKIKKYKPETEKSEILSFKKSDIANVSASNRYLFYLLLLISFIVSLYEIKKEKNLSNTVALKEELSSSNKIKSSGGITIDLLQINDVYEISPLNNDSIGGMARIATLKKQFLQKNENTMLLIAGDFLSPSVFNSVKLNGEKVAGNQMIAAMNTAGVDLAILGNHEFDISYNVLQRRINESNFQWLASNVYHSTNSSNKFFQKNGIDIPQTIIQTFYNKNGEAFKIGFFGITTPDNKGDSAYAAYDDMLNVSTAMYKRLLGKCDAIIAVTHQDMKLDSLLALKLSGLAAIIGGHEHDMRFSFVGNVCITKAHANAKTAFDVKLIISRENNPSVKVLPTLIPVNTSIPQDTLTKIVCDKWMSDAKKFFTDSAFAVDKVISDNFNIALDGTDAAVRSGSTNLSKLIANAMLYAAKNKGCKLSVYNAGSIRVDDIINPPLTEYAILRALPYGGSIIVADIKGSLLKKMISKNNCLKNDGRFLQFSDNVSTAQPALNGKRIDDTTFYKVAIAQYLIKNNAEKLNELYKEPTSVKNTQSSPPASDSSLYDVRKAVIEYIKKIYGNKKHNKLR